MRPRLKRREMGIDQIMAIGLVWGHLRARQFEPAFLLAEGCLQVWPDDHNLVLMHAYAAAEVLEPIDRTRLLAAGKAASHAGQLSSDWIKLVLRRAMPAAVAAGEQP